MPIHILWDHSRNLPFGHAQNNAEVNRVTNFNEDDVKAVATALIKNSVYFDEGYPNSRNPRDGYRCEYCDAKEFQKREDLKHDLDCPVLIARDLLT